MEFEHRGYARRIVFRPGAVDALPEEIAALGARRVMVFAGGSQAERAVALLARLGDREAWLVEGVRPHLPRELADRVQAEARERGADALVCIGGGSATGLAKVAALAVDAPIVAVPTTYAGSEMTPIYGITEGGEKRTARDPRVVPRVVVYDPLLTLSMPRDVTGASGLNALAHAVGALFTPGADPVERPVARQAVRTLRRGIPAAHDRPGDVAARSEALFGALLAGMSFAAAGGSYHHAVCHVLGGAYGVPHALTHALVLPHSVALAATLEPAAHAELGTLLETPSPQLDLHRLAAAVTAPSRLADAGLPESLIDEATDRVLAGFPPRYGAGREAVRALVAGAVTGSPPPP
ncbi:MAG TPA: iron-containing alcohol dehydrogenase [Candidatus Dormibacteraeota bacterium]|nr:iron-containing alcohol dehydrogenase [Candidatus Dormibacteraeota bacterium]